MDGRTQCAGQVSMDDGARAQLIALLRAHEPADQKEAHDRERMLQYAHTLSEPFSRTERDAHFTASAILMDTTHLTVCLVYHRKLSRWLQPGGHFEPDDAGQPEAAALREVAEETGCRATRVSASPLLLDVDIHPIPAHGPEPAHLHLDLRLLAETPERTGAHDAAESHAIEWLSWAAALERADDPSLRRALHKAMRRAGC